MAKGLGGTTCSLSGYGAASNTRRSICKPTKLSPRHEIRSAGISTFTTDDDRIRALTTAPRTKPTSIFLRSARRPNPGRGSTYRRGIIVQTTGTGSIAARMALIVGSTTFDRLLSGVRFDEVDRDVLFVFLL
jgi:hypothetical protein